MNNLIDWSKTEDNLLKSLELAALWNVAPTDLLEKSVLAAEDRKDTDRMHYLLPKKRMFPTPDANHARLAYQMAKRALNAGHITQKEYEEVRRKAKKRLKELGEPMDEDNED